MKELSQFRAADFVADKNFVLAYYSGETDRYRKEVLEQAPQSEAEFDEACRLMAGVSLRRRGYSHEELVRQTLRLEASLAENARLVSRKRNLRVYSGIAATVALLMTVSYLWYAVPNESQTEPMLTFDESILNSSETQLFRADELLSTSSDDETIVDHRLFEKESSHEKAGKQLRLVVPYGKRALLTLADGSKIWVNAGSVVSYPERFSGNKREIALDGEIYIEVAPDKKKPFVIKTQDMDIRVLGTRFNLSSYRSESEKSVVLVSGKVEVESHGQDPVTLNPNQRFFRNGNQSAVEEVRAADYITWKEGYLYLSKQDLSQILVKIARYYNISIHSDTPLHYPCSGRLKLAEKPEDVLQMISETAPVRFEKEGYGYRAYAIK